MGRREFCSKSVGSRRISRFRQKIVLALFQKAKVLEPKEKTFIPLYKLVRKSNKLFSNLRWKNVITETENNYFRFNFKKATNLSKLYILPKIHKGLCKVPRRLVISNCRTPIEKVSEFLNHYSQPIMKQGGSYIKT